MTPLRIGVTGGIGSGKSVVCRLFSLWGAPVYDSDSRAKYLMAGSLAGRITELLGSRAFDAKGDLDRGYIASRVFADADLLARLNGVVHPAVNADFERWANSMPGCAYVVAESAILFSSGFHSLMDITVAVRAPEELRAHRVSRRDGSPPGHARARMAAQGDESAPADHIIENDGRDSLIGRVAALHKLFSNGD